MIVSFISLGCDKNRVNTEQMMALCLQSGMTVQEDCAGSDVVVVNTCGFIDSAKLEAIETILSVAELKAAGRVGKILVTGCLSQRYQAELLEELPEVDGIMGTGSYGDIVPPWSRWPPGRNSAALPTSAARWRSCPGSSPPLCTMPTCALPRGAATAAPTALSRPCGASTAAAPWRTS